MHTTDVMTRTDAERFVASLFTKQADCVSPIQAFVDSLLAPRSCKLAAAPPTASPPLKMPAANTFPAAPKPPIAPPPTKYFTVPKPAPMPSYQHPSGALQLGRLSHIGTPAQQLLFGASAPPGSATPQQKGYYVHSGDSPGQASGSNVLHVSAHGGGSPGNYSLANPTADQGWGRREEVGVDAKGLDGIGEALPQGCDPRSIFSGACNGDAGATPATYGAAFQKALGRRPSLDHMVMTPPGQFGTGFHAPYLAPLMDKLRGDGNTTGANEYRLRPGGDPAYRGDWTDTGTYTDGRQAVLPLLAAGGEMKELGRHLGLGEELGGGGFMSYLDKIKRINLNPDATYWQKVRSNLARPVGTAAATVQPVLDRLNEPIVPPAWASDPNFIGE